MRRERLVQFGKIMAAAGLLVALAAFLWLSVGSQRSTPVSAATFLITVGDFWFCDQSNEGGDCETEIAVGDEVTWVFGSTTHTTTECTGDCGSVIGDPGSREWHSGNMSNDAFPLTFNTPGTFEYQCNIHPSQMRGTIIVGGGAPPTLPVPPEGTPTPVATLPVPPSPGPSETATTAPTSTAVPGPISTPPGMKGDVNGDGIINPIDAALVLQFSAGMLPALPSFERGDVNQDGTVNAIDAALILQFAAGLLSTL